VTSHEQLAAQLTEAQQRELCALDAGPSDRSITWCVRFGYRLERLGLVRRKLLTDRPYLTSLGRAVKALIKQDPAK
jgi:hypothetical protein